VSIHADYEKNFELTPKRGWARWLRRLSSWCPEFVLRRADLVLPIRQHLAAWAKRHGAADNRIRIIPHGLDLTLYAADRPRDDVRRRYEITLCAPIVSFVGRLSKYNYVDDVLDVAERVIATRPETIFVLIGDGEERERIERRLAARADLRRGVRLAGFRSAEEVVTLRLASAVSLCPMGGFSLIEACAAGNPVVAYDVDWHSEVVSHNVTGLLVPEGDVEALAGAVVRLLDDRALSDRLGANARAFVAAHHDERKTSALKRDSYSELLNRHHAA
jgi:glycosyltransferase involved in cell wall biosynthesis